MRALRKPASLRETLVLLVAAGAVVVALVEFVPAFRSLNNRAAHNAAQSETERMLEITGPLGVSREFVLETLRLLPEGASYVVSTGPHAAATPLLHSALRGYLENLLLPRVQSTETPGWLLCYGCEPADWQGRLDVVWRREGLLIAKVIA